MHVKATALDRIDGGITMCLRLPGTWPTARIRGSVTLKDIVLDVYLPPREIEEYSSRLEQPVAAIAHIFAEEIAAPHLRQLRIRSKLSGVTVLPALHPVVQPSNAADSTRRSQLIPPSIQQGSAYFRFRTHAHGALKKSRAIHDFMVADDTASASAFKHVEKPAVEVHGKPLDILLSLGPHTDDVLDAYGLDDALIPRLRQMVLTVRHTRWIQVLQEDGWKLDMTRAVALSQALLVDAQQGVDFKLSSRIEGPRAPIWASTTSWHFRSIFELVLMTIIIFLFWP
jgi:hypothetical protein